jgi:phosphonopyruvate decarboxylase
VLNARAFLQALQARGVEFYTGVPDSLLAPFCALVEELPAARHVTAVNEGAAIGLAIGHYLAIGSIPLVYVQNSGLGNAINPLLSLADPDVYGVPMLLLIGWRGAPGQHDEPQHAKQGRVTPALLKAMEIPVVALDADSSDPGPLIDAALDQALRSTGPSALLARPGAFSADAVSRPLRRLLPLTREAAIARIVALLPGDALVVSTTGMISRELFARRDQVGHCHERDFLCIGGMGHAISVALGMALAKPSRRVVCLDGDGAALMHLGALATLAHSGSNLCHIVLNNGAHDSVGGQPTVALDLDLPGIAAAMGYARTFRVENEANLAHALAVSLAESGPSFLEIQVAPGSRPGLGRPSVAPSDAKRTFMGAV